MVRGIAIGALLLSAGCAVQPRSMASPRGTLAEVIEAEGARDAQHPSIERALGAQQAMLRVAALRALARIESPAGTPLAAPLVGDKDPTVATWASFALGQIGGDSSEAALWDAAGGRSVKPDEALLALGRAGTATTAREIAPNLNVQDPAVKSAAAIALGLLAKRLGKGLKTDAYVPVLQKMAADPSRDVRFAATYALMRFATTAAGLALIPSLADKDPDLRVHAVRGIGLAGSAPQVLDSVLDDPDFRVRVQAARALGLVGSSTKAEAPAAGARLFSMSSREVDRLKGADLHQSGRITNVILELIAAATQIEQHGDRARIAIEERLQAIGPPRPETASDRARIDCALAFAEDLRSETVRRVKGCGDASLLAWRRFALEAQLHAKKKDVPALLALSKHADERVRAAATDALGSVETDQATQALLDLTASEDPYVAGAAAGGLSGAIGRGLRSPALMTALEASLSRLLQQDDPGFALGPLDSITALGPDAKRFEAQLIALDKDPRAAIRRRAAKARSAISGAAVGFSGAPGGIDPSANTPLASGRTTVRMRTTRGDVVMVLFGDVAPRTVGHVLSLIEEGFYNDKTFHRIVPDFVAQGGCPRGDGWGGPRRAILDEPSPLPFVRGAVGIATSGRDTGGSQFFIMHSRHPHLEGGYTLFGQVVEGMEIVDALVQDDRLIEVRIEDGSPVSSAQAQRAARL